MHRRSFSLLTLLGVLVTITLLGNTLLVSALFFSQIVSGNKAQTQIKYQQSFYQAHQTIDTYLLGMVNTAAVLSADNDLQASIAQARNLSNPHYFEAQKAIRETLVSAIHLNTYIRDIALYDGDHTYRYNQTGFESMYQQQLPAEDWFSSLRNREVPQTVIPEYRVSEVLNLYIYATVFSRSLAGDRPEVIALSMDSERIHAAVNSADIKEDSLLCLFDEEGRLLYTNAEERAEALAIESMDLENLKSGTEQQLGGQRHFIVSQRGNYSGWLLVSFTPSSVLASDFYAISPGLVVSIVLVALLSIVVFLLTYSGLSRPLKSLVEAMNSAVNRQFGRVELTSRYTEMRAIGNAFNSMNQEIAQYIGNIKETEREKRAAELKALEAQINPHFIYNTLDAIKWVAILNNANVVADMTSSFVALLQISLAGGMDSIRVETEAEHVRHYVKIMQFRYNHSIDVRFEMAPQVLSRYTLKLIIQPFVENCFFHAFDSGAKDCVITIRCFEGEGQLIIEIEDNGKGLEDVPRQSSKMLKGIGIQNIDERLKLSYGAGYGVSILALPKGTLVRINQPLRYMEDDGGTDTNADSGG